MSIEDIVDVINRTIEDKRKELNIPNSSHLVLQTKVNPHPLFKVFKEFELILWLIKGKDKYRVLTTKLTYKVTESKEDSVLNIVHKEFCYNLINWVRTEEYNNIVNNIKYVEIKLEDKQKSEELTYTKSVRINDSKIIEDLKKIINSGTEQVKENTEWPDISPFITLFAENGEEYEISTYDGDTDNEILISKYTNSENFDWKKMQF